MELPVGVSDFRKLIEYRNPLTGEPYLYVDKTDFIKEIVGDGTEVIVITRPRRFGKTINMSTLQYFYAPAVDGQITKGLFNGLEISKDPDAMKGQGSCPVIFISFKDVDGSKFEKAYGSICEEIKQLFSSHKYLLKSSTLEEYEKNDFRHYLIQEKLLLKSSPSTREKIETLMTGNSIVALVDEHKVCVLEAK